MTIKIDDSVDFSPAAITLVKPHIECVHCSHYLAETEGPMIQRYCPDANCVRFGLLTVVHDKILTVPPAPKRPGYNGPVPKNIERPKPTPAPPAVDTDRIMTKDAALHCASGVIKILGRNITTGLSSEGIDDALKQIREALDA